MNLTHRQRHQGNPTITAWCPKCQCRVVPLRDGNCGWCSHPLTGQARQDATRRRIEREKQAERERAARRRAAELGYDPNRPPRQNALQVADALEHRGAMTTVDLARQLDISEDTVRGLLKRLAANGAVRKVGITPSPAGGAPPSRLGTSRRLQVTDHLTDARGYKLAASCRPGYGKGTTPKNKGRTYPADPPTAAEIIAIMRACHDTPHGRRLRALVVFLWRTGLRIHEALLVLEYLVLADAVEVARRDREVRVAELPLKEVDGRPLPDQIDGQGVTELVRSDALADAGAACSLVKLLASVSLVPGPADGGAGQHAEDGTRRVQILLTLLKPWEQLLPAPRIETADTALAALPAANDNGSGHGVEVRLEVSHQRKAPVLAVPDLMTVLGPASPPPTVSTPPVAHLREVSRAC